MKVTAADVRRLPFALGQVYISKPPIVPSDGIRDDPRGRRVTVFREASSQNPFPFLPEKFTCNWERRIPK
jgi:hypothetical protein